MAATLAKPIAFMGFEFPTLVHAMEAHNCLEPEVLSTEGVLGQYGPGMKTLYPDKTLRAKEMQKYPPDMMGLLALEKVKLRKAGNKMAGNMSIRYKEKSDWLVDEKVCVCVCLSVLPLKPGVSHV